MKDQMKDESQDQDAPRGAVEPREVGTLEMLGVRALHYSCVALSAACGAGRWLAKQATANLGEAEGYFGRKAVEYQPEIYRSAKLLGVELTEDQIEEIHARLQAQRQAPGQATTQPGITPAQAD